MSAGVYQIICLPTGKRYIGSSCDIKKRWREHRSALRNGRHENVYLQHAWDKYDERSFEFATLEECAIGIEREREQRYLDSCNAEFNILDEACGFVKGHKPTAGMTGRRHTVETRRRMSEAQKAKPSMGMKGKRHSAETKAKMREVALRNNRRCWKHTDKAKEKISAASKRMWVKADKGKRHMMNPNLKPRSID